MSAPRVAGRAWALLAILAASPGCAATSRKARSETDKGRIAHARELSVERLAPVPYERFVKTRKRADKSTPDSVERGDYEAEARLWLETAIADAERQRLAEQRLAEERALVEQDAVIVALERERESWAREAELRAAQAIASNEAKRALARAAVRPSLRVKMPREDVKLAALALLSRIELLALTLESLGKQPAGVARLHANIKELEALVAKDPEASLTRADKALFFALSLFSELRGAGAGPSAEEKAVLAEEVASAGARPTRGDQGLSSVLEHAFSDFAVVPVAERVIERLCSLSKAHPRGPVLLAVQAKKPAQAEARMRWVRQRFAKAGCEGQRFTVARAKSEGDALETTWLAY